MKVIRCIISLILIKFYLNIDAEFEFTNYYKQYNKDYQSFEEYQIRKQIFLQTLEKINKVNNNPNSIWQAGLNQHSDKTEEELKRLRGYLHKPKSNSIAFSFLEIEEQIKIPKSLDYRNIYKTKPKIQGYCGSCWAFTATALLESHTAIKYGKELNLSEQQLVDCVPNPNHCGGTGGCHGLIIETALEYVSNNGIVLQESYQYNAIDNKCNLDKSNNPVVTIDDFVSLPSNDYDSLIRALVQYGPIGVAIDASEFSIYKSGVFNGVDGKCGSTINHAVVIVGFGEDEVYGPYWVIRNSWGEDFGENGHIRVKRERNAEEVKCDFDYYPQKGTACEGENEPVVVCGFCGILFQSTYPKGVKLL